MKKLIGRKKELKILSDALTSGHSELIVVHGRRRIGKTFLIREAYKDHIKFELIGINGISLKDQLLNFHLVLSAQYKKAVLPNSWIEAFSELGKYLDKLKSKQKKVVFIDEFPWLDSRRSKFLPSFENFWNAYASKRSDLVVVVCGSAASYMIKRIIRNKGGLHNRLTRRINLKPFSLFETEFFLKSRKVNLSRYDILQLYMAIGGIPHYLEYVSAGQSVAQIIDTLFFKTEGMLRNEFREVFASLFDQYENHESIIRTLAKVRKGLTRNSILTKSKINSGGTLTKTLDDLEQSGFIERYTPYRGVKNSLYRLTDEYSLFYLKYVEKSKVSQRAYWIQMQGQQSFKSWAGFTFETICIKHVDQIIKALDIAGMSIEHGTWLEHSNKNGAQIDLLLDRADNVIHICEMKFYTAPFAITKSYAGQIANKENLFRLSTKTRKSIFITFVTTYGIVSNPYSKQLVQNEITMDALFVDL